MPPRLASPSRTCWGTPAVANASQARQTTYRPAWPELDYAAALGTRQALHLWLQIVGKYALSHSPWTNHGWHASLRLTPRGIRTQRVADAGGTEVEFDLVGSELLIRSANGRSAGFPLAAMSVADFFARFRASVEYVGGSPGSAQPVPNELEQVVPFAEDTAERPYDATHVRDLHRALLLSAEVFDVFRSAFLGKCSPVHLFWGSFDLAFTRFSGRLAPCHPGGVPHLADIVAREAYSHELHSAGFWPGDARLPEAAFYAYAYPEPDGFRRIEGLPPGTRYDGTLGEFVLPYAAVRGAADPAATLLDFLERTYAAAADLGRWDRATLECAPGTPLQPRDPGCISEGARTH